MNPRSCVACRKHQPPETMFRVVRSPDDKVFLDRDGDGQGRGAYLCRDVKCVVIARKKKLLERALRVPVPSEIYETIEKATDQMPATTQIESPILELLGMARRGGNLIIGQDRVFTSMSENPQLLILVASDCSESVLLRLQRRELPYRTLNLNRHELGNALGLNQAQILALETRSGFARKVGDLLPEGGEAFDENESL